MFQARAVDASSPDPLRAAKLLGASACMLQTMTAGMLLHEMSEHDRLLESLRQRLSAEAIDAALREGRSMSFEDACALAMSDLPHTAAIAPVPAEPQLDVRDLGPLRISLRNTIRRKARLVLTLATLVLAGAIFTGVNSTQVSMAASLDRRVLIAFSCDRIG